MEEISSDVAQYLLNGLLHGDLQRMASTCKFFRNNARKVVSRRLNNALNFNLDQNPSAVPVHALKLCEALNMPIDQYDKKEERYASPLTMNSTHDIRSNAGVVAICQKKNEQGLCMVGTFVLDSANPEICHVRQFIAGVDEKGCVYLDRLTNEKAAEIIESALNVRGIGTPNVFGETTDDILKFLRKLFDRAISREIVTFETLFSDFSTGCNMHPVLRDPIARAIRGEESPSPRMGCCSIS